MRFVLIDRLVALEPGRRAEAQTTFLPGSSVFADHFPGFPLVPGVLLTEAMGQAAGWLLGATSGFARWPLLALIHQAKFVRPVVPGERIDIAAELRGVHGDDADIAAVAAIAGERVASARLLFHQIEPPLQGAEAERFRVWAADTFARLGGPALLASSGAASLNGGHPRA